MIYSKISVNKIINLKFCIEWVYIFYLVFLFYKKAIYICKNSNNHLLIKVDFSFIVDQIEINIIFVAIIKNILNVPIFYYYYDL